ncbi:MAG: GntR family transcriptional regulator [Afipia sp.]|jgi:DNA-binding GntR family transcriptional regulator
MSQSYKLKQAIEDAVIAGEFLPGDRLDEISLAERFGVSRTPVREALLQLGAEGFIEIRPRRGAIVSILSPTQLFEMFETMAEVESACGRLAARRLTPENDAAMEEAHRACERAAQDGDTEQYYAMNRNFHEAIYRATRNAFLADQAFALHKRLSAYRRVQLRARNRLLQSLQEHAGILEAIRAGNEQLAANRLHGHVLVQGERFSDMMLNLKAEGRAAKAAG